MGVVIREDHGGRPFVDLDDAHAAALLYAVVDPDGAYDSSRFNVVNRTDEVSNQEFLDHLARWKKALDDEK